MRDYFAWLRELGITPKADGPLFLCADGKPLCAAALARALREGAVRLGRSTERLSTYGLRIGSATHLKRCGVDEVLIMLAGGWASVAGMRGYCRDVPNDHAWLSEALADRNPTARVAPRGSRAAAAGAGAAAAAAPAPALVVGPPPAKRARRGAGEA